MEEPKKELPQDGGTDLGQIENEAREAAEIIRMSPKTLATMRSTGKGPV